LASNVGWWSNSAGILLHGCDGSVSRIWARNNINVAGSEFRVCKFILELVVVGMDSKGIVKLAEIVGKQSELVMITISETFTSTICIP
jgi:hypothetical protein